MEVEAAKLIGAGLATIGVAGSTSRVSLGILQRHHRRSGKFY